MQNMRENQPIWKIYIKNNRKNFTSRTEATCTTPYIIYLVTCRICGKQRAGSTEKLPVRILNYYSHIRRKRRTNKFAIHFQEAVNHRRRYKYPNN